MKYSELLKEYGIAPISEFRSTRTRNMIFYYLIDVNFYYEFFSSDTED